MNTYNERIALKQPIIAENGQETFITKDVFCAVKSVGYNEFYSATQQGFQPELIFALADYRDYDLQPLAVYRGVEYNVIRTYRKGATELEMTCERVNTNGNI